MEKKLWILFFSRCKWYSNIIFLYIFLFDCFDEKIFTFLFHWIVKKEMTVILKMGHFVCHFERFANSIFETKSSISDKQVCRHKELKTSLVRIIQVGRTYCLLHISTQASHLSAPEPLYALVPLFVPVSHLYNQLFQLDLFNLRIFLKKEYYRRKCFSKQFFLCLVGV